MKNVEEKIIIHLKAKLLPYLIIFLKTNNYLEYTIGNLFDPPPKPKKNEKTDEYLERISAKQALRISRYNHLKSKITAAPYRIKRPDFSMYEPKSRDTLEKLIDTIFFLEDSWEKHFQTTLRRKMTER